MKEKKKVDKRQVYYAVEHHHADKKPCKLSNELIWSKSKSNSSRRPIPMK
jgi:hypothetical protein